MRLAVIGTAGHIDHGKTALVKRLTGVDTDRLPEEKTRGISIDLGFARLVTPAGTQVGIVDVPGHERFVKNMLAGVGGIDLVLLVIAADEGVMPQTREHLAIVQLLGIRKGIVVLTKSDLVERDWMDMVRRDVRALLTGGPLAAAPMVEFSATTGVGQESLLAAIDEVLADSPARSTAEPARLPVDRVFTVEGFGTVVTGTLWRGR
ncbi:MAG: selenocysteine-specific translation elongation factor, partial [Candidatus Eisenbacteria bacterium]